MALNFYTSLIHNWWWAENLTIELLDKTTNKLAGKPDERVQSVLQQNVEIMQVPNDKFNFPYTALC
jgi:hypothetical protein